MHRRAVWISPFLLLFLFFPQIPRVGAVSPGLPAGFVREMIAHNLDTPTAFVIDGDSYLVAEKEGTVRVVLPDGSIRPEPYLTLSVTSDLERGLLGIELHPDYPDKPFVYVYYTTGPGALNYSGAPKNRVSRFRTLNGVGVDEKILLDDIPSDSGRHNAGDLQFGTDGKLYIATGDGGANMNLAQNLKSLAGKILRLKPNGKIPKTNPFYGRKNRRGEIFAYGFRNPFRITVRRSNQSLFAADVGWNEWEELDMVQTKGNYGWPLFEGPCPINTPCDPATTDFQGTIPPIYYYSHHSTGDRHRNHRWCIR